MVNTPERKSESPRHVRDAAYIPLNMRAPVRLPVVVNGVSRKSEGRLREGVCQQHRQDAGVHLSRININQSAALPDAEEHPSETRPENLRCDIQHKPSHAKPAG
jgi:hypothetical protein